MTRAISVLLITLFFLIFFIGRCAHKVAPSGGPEDKTSPGILSTIPQANAVQVTELSFIEIEFSEPVRKPTLNNNFWILPELSSDLEIKWQGNRRVRFFLKDSLAANQTYVFTLGTGIRDFRNNGLSSPLRLAFSTGAAIDSGAISGKVFSDLKFREIYIYAYRIENTLKNDSLVFQKPLYYTQLDDQNMFDLNHLPSGSYRLFALGDEDLNKKYTFESDLIGIPAFDVTIDSIEFRINQYNLFLIKEDSSAPQIKEVDTLSTQEIAVLFTEPIHGPESVSVQITDSLTDTIYEPVGISFDNRQQDRISLFCQGIPPGKRLKILLKNIKDKSNNMPADSLYSIYVTSASRGDTLVPRFINVKPENEAENVSFDSKVEILFNVPIDTSQFDKLLSLTNENEDIIRGKINYSDLRNPIFLPDTILQNDTKFILTVQMDRLRDLWGRIISDSLFTSSFRSKSLSDLGEISGVVTSSDSLEKQALIFAESITENVTSTIITKIGENYLLPYLPAGAYIVTAVLDNNANNIWDKGKTIPWNFAEPFIIKEDTVVVRKRWTTQGVNFQFGNKK